MPMNIPRIVISALSGGSGKTMISVGLARALSRRGYRVQTFKKGPDYIDTLWASLASGLPPRNLDPYINGDVSMLELFKQACCNTGANFFARQAVTEPGGDCSGKAARAPGRTGSSGSCDALPDIAIIEGNRGLFDGLDLSGSCSTAELARQLAAPVVLTVNCTKMTRTTAALVKGCKDFEAGVDVAGVILNQASRERHRAIVRQAVEELAGVPVFGVVPRLAQEPFEERHNGLLGEEAVLAAPPALRRLDQLADIIEEHVDLDALVALAKSAPALQDEKEQAPEAGAAVSLVSFPRTETGSANGCQARKPRIGFVRDAAFWFYYTENLEALERAGAEVLPVSLLDVGVGQGATAGASGPSTPANPVNTSNLAGPDSPAKLSSPISRASSISPVSPISPAVSSSLNELDELDGLYLGAGFPEDYAALLAAGPQKERLKAMIEAGMPVYAEGSGLYYLARELKHAGRVYPMCGVFDLSVELGRKPQGIGYVRAVVEGDNPFLPAGTQIGAHEFHYAVLEMPPAMYAASLMRMSKGGGLLPQSRFRSADITLGGLAAARHGSERSKGEQGCPTGRDGLLYKNCFASLLQIFAPGAPFWAGNFVCAARKFAAGRR